jgi:MFS family permease
LSPAHPRQWPLQRKIYDTAIICLLEFLTTVVSNSGSDVSREAGPEIGLSREMAIFCLTTLYLLGQAFGGLLLPPVCEAFGGKLIYAGSSAGFTAMCLMIGLAPSTATVVVGRFVSGALSAMPTVVACGSIENMWDTQDRIWAIDIWAIAGFLGMAIGPVYAVYVSESNMGW